MKADAQESTSGQQRTQIGRYELYGQIAAGGMATVYAGRLREQGGGVLSPVVAIKRVHEHLARDEELVTALIEEARITKHIRHSNVVATLDIEQAADASKEGSELLLVMEYVHGETLAGLLKACARSRQVCPPSIAAGIIYGALLGLHAAHVATDPSTGKSLNIVHRDVSPQNIMVGADGVPRLLDFGIAKAVDSVLHTRTGELKGKIPYMAPEILRFDPATTQSDVWAMSVVFWELLSARRLFKAASEMEVWGQILTMDLAPTGTSAPLDVIILRGLARTTSDRYATALEMAEEIDRTSLRASSTEIEAWVLSMVGPALAERAAKIASVVVPAVVPANAARAAEERAPPPSSSSRGRLLGVIAALLSAAAIVGVLVGVVPRLRGAPRAPAVTPPATTSIAPTTTLDPMADPTPAPTVTPAPSLSSVHSSSTSTRPLATKPHATVDPCDPPYSIDDGGRRVYKLPCLKR